MLWPAFSGRFLAASSALLVGLGVCQAQTTKPAGTTPPVTASKSASHAASSASAHGSSAAHHPVAAASHGKTKSRKRKRTAGWRSHGQQKIDPQRAHDIQEALIREHYLDGSPSGAWDLSTQKAMQRYQADHGWQSTSTPDSRALIKLGLGPDHAHLLNPESAMTGAGDPPHASAVSPAASPAVPVTSTPLPAGDPTPTAPEQSSPEKK